MYSLPFEALWMHSSDNIRHDLFFVFFRWGGWGGGGKSNTEKLKYKQVCIKKNSESGLRELEIA